MPANVTLWGRRGEAASADAQRLLKAHGYAADRVLDVEAAPPSGDELARLAKGLGGSLRALVRPDEAGAAPADDAELAAWLAADPRRLRTPILLTPKGAVAGFAERKWLAFLDVGRSR